METLTFILEKSEMFEVNRDTYLLLTKQIKAAVSRTFHCYVSEISESEVMHFYRV